MVLICKIGIFINFIGSVRLQTTQNVVFDQKTSFALGFELNFTEKKGFQNFKSKSQFLNSKIWNGLYSIFSTIWKCLNDVFWSVLWLFVIKEQN